jgi:hypothetical protein
MQNCVIISCAAKVIDSIITISFGRFSGCPDNATKKVKDCSLMFKLIDFKRWML